MTDRRRNLAVIGLLLVVLGAAVVLIVQKPTRLGLDLRGGVELVYEARPTPQVPEVTPQAVEDAITTIRERTDQLGVSEPEIQRAGPNQISVSLPAVDNPDRAIEQVGTTAQLQFYDWEPNVLQEEDGKLVPLTEVGGGAAGGQQGRPEQSLYEAATLAARAEPRAEPDDVPAAGPAPEVRRRFGGDARATQAFYDRRNDTRQGSAFYLFGPSSGPARPPLENPAGTCAELLSQFEERRDGRRPPAPRAPPRGSACSAELAALGSFGPPAGSTVVEVPRGIVVVKAEQPERAPANARVDDHWVLEDDSELSGNEIRGPEQSFDPQTNEPIVTFNFTSEGREAFARVTRRVAIRGSEQILPPGTPPDVALQRFAISLDNQLVSLATIDFRENPEGIDGRTGAQINGIGNLQSTQDLANNLRIGALPVDLELVSNTQVSATLGRQALDQGVLAAGAGLLLTLLFLVAFYRVLGVVAAVTLVVYAALLYAIVELIPITLTLPGIAGMILTLGVAADANIVIFERIKEEARAGAPIPRAISAGYAKALRTIIDANVVTIGVAFILFLLATAGVKGFAFTLGVGTIVSLFTAVLATSAILGSIARTRLLRSRFALGAGPERMSTRFDFMGASKWFFSTSGVIMAIGAIAIAGLGLGFGIDFEGGTRIQTPLERPAGTDQVRQVLPPRLQAAEIQEVNDPELGANVIQISSPELRPGEENQVRQALDRSFGVPSNEFVTSTVGPTFGAQIATTAVIAIFASLLLISLYIGLRFQFKFAVPVLIALTHDLLITAGVYAIFGREVTTSTVAALLTIVGYSLYDTIIVFDRIRENVPRMPRATFSQIVNRSMSEVLTRSLVTSLSTLFPITALMIFGGETLRDFGFALLVGVASGTYSSIFIAAPVLTAWKERESVYRRRREVMESEHGGVVPAYAPAGGPGSAATAVVPAGQRVVAAGPGNGRRTPDASPTGSEGSGSGNGAPGGDERGGPARPGAGGARAAGTRAGAATEAPAQTDEDATPADRDPGTTPREDGETTLGAPSRPDAGDGGPEGQPDNGGASRRERARNRRRKRHGRR